jgi:hypothetical protein
MHPPKSGYREHNNQAYYADPPQANRNQRYLVDPRAQNYRQQQETSIREHRAQILNEHGQTRQDKQKAAYPQQANLQNAHLFPTYGQSHGKDVRDVTPEIHSETANPDLHRPNAGALYHKNMDTHRWEPSSQEYGQPHWGGQQADTTHLPPGPSLLTLHPKPAWPYLRKLGRNFEFACPMLGRSSIHPHVLRGVISQDCLPFTPLDRKGTQYQVNITFLGDA